MAIRLRDLLQIPYFSSVTVEAGKKGLDRIVNSTTTLDYEYAKGYEMTKQVFLCHDLLVSSLLFAKDDIPALLRAEKELIDVGVSGLAYKAIFFDKLPQEALDLANTYDFPILRFGMELNMEDFLFHVMESIQLERRQNEKERLLQNLLFEKIPRSELGSAAKEIDPYMGPYIYPLYVMLKESLGFHKLQQLCDGPTGVARIDKNITVCRYRNGFFMFLYGSHPEEKRYMARFEDVSAYLDWTLYPAWIGKGELCRCPEELDLAVQQAYFASRCAKVKEQDQQSYATIGLYQILIPYASSPHMRKFMEGYLAPLLKNTSDQATELLKTAIAYVQAEGHLDITAKELYCHRNTVRYRLNKLHDLLSPGVNDMVFYTKLSTAVRIYLLNTDIDILNGGQ